MYYSKIRILLIVRRIFKSIQMKTSLLLLVSLAISTQMLATHLMGGEMTVEHINNNNYIIHLTAYRDTIGIPFATTANFKIFDSNMSLIQSDTVVQDPGSGNLMAGYPYGVEVYFFHDTISVPGNGTYTVEWLNCCRNAAIQNLNAPLNENMSLSTSFTHFSGPNYSSTPVFLAPPVTYLPINQPWQYNSLPFDVDGDSLSWTIDTPLTDIGLYATGWNTPSANQSGPFSLDPITGQIDWTPDMLGNFVASILVEEFRSGNKIGEIRRDYQMIVIPDTTKCPRISNFNIFPKDNNGHAYMNLSANTPVSIIMIAEDPEGEQVYFSAFGEPLLPSQNPATFTVNPYNITDISATFSWTPDISQSRANPYLVVFRTQDSKFSFDETVMFYVGNTTTGTAEHSYFESENIYPNPTTGYTHLPVTLYKPAKVDIAIYNTLGELVTEFDLGRLDSGEHLVNFNLKAENGIYFVMISTDGILQTTQKVTLNK